VNKDGYTAAAVILHFQLHYWGTDS